MTSSGEGVGPRVTKRTILIVEDDKLAARELEQQLSSAGYRIAGIAASPDEANALAARMTPDLLLMRFAQAARSADSLDERFDAAAARPVVFVTEPIEEAALRQTGVTESLRYLVKPFSTRELQAVVELALCKHA